jgi:hypothetical protein
MYLFLSTQTADLNKDIIPALYLIIFFCIIYTASGIKKAPYLGMILGILNALSLLSLRYYPITPKVKSFGWSYNINAKIEILIIIFLLLSIMIRLIEAAAVKDTVLHK